MGKLRPSEKALSPLPRPSKIYETSTRGRTEDQLVPLLGSSAPMPLALIGGILERGKVGREVKAA